jgi:hypothetical protein
MIKKEKKNREDFRIILRAERNVGTTGTILKSGPQLQIANDGEPRARPDD